MICIYKLTSPSGRIYIGQTIDFKNRISHYKRLDCKSQRLVYNSILKYGYDYHVIEIIEELEINNLDSREIYWIEFYKSNRNKYPDNKGLNLCEGGSSIRGYKQTPEQLEKLSKIRKGKVTTLGYKHTDDSRKIMSDFRKKKVIDLETLKIFDSVSDAALEHNINKFTLTGYLNGTAKNKTNLIYLEKYKITEYL